MHYSLQKDRNVLAFPWIDAGGALACSQFDNMLVDAA